MMRSVWAILAGFILIGVLGFGTDAILRVMSPGSFNEGGGSDNLAILLGQMLYSALYGVVGCYVAARLAPSKPMKHALILGVIGVFAAGAANAALWGHVPAWYVITNVLLVLPLAWLGGRIRENQIASRPPSMPPGTVPA